MTVFLQELAKDGNVARSCRKAGFGRALVDELKSADSDFEIAFHNALADANDALEGEARRRAIKGIVISVKTDIRSNTRISNKLSSSDRKYSDTLLIALMTINKEKYIKLNSWKSDSNKKEKNKGVSVAHMIAEDPDPGLYRLKV